MGMPIRGAFLVARRELQARIAFVLEIIAPRHQIAVLSEAELVASWRETNGYSYGLRTGTAGMV
jgi:hypothetical protein